MGFCFLNDQKGSAHGSLGLKVGAVYNAALLPFSLQQSLTVLVPRVWPFLRHTISSVRRAALQTLFTLLSKADQVNRHRLFCTYGTQFPYKGVRSLNQGRFIRASV